MEELRLFADDGEPKVGEGRNGGGHRRRLKGCLAFLFHVYYLIFNHTASLLCRDTGSTAFRNADNTALAVISKLHMLTVLIRCRFIAACVTW